MYTHITEKFTFHYMEKTDTISMWFNGRRIARCKDVNDGCRQFFRLGNYFIKAEYLCIGWMGQCKDEVFAYGRLDNCDKQYFTRLLACSDMDDCLRWTMFPWYNLKACDTSTQLFQICRNKVERLCNKYGIQDVLPYANHNWFIHKGKPLIVDCGITDGGYR